MNPKTEFKNLAAIQPTVLWPGLAALVLALTVPARAETRPAAIPLFRHRSQGHGGLPG